MVQVRQKSGTKFHRNVEHRLSLRHEMNTQLHFRCLRVSDQQSVKQLHEELFPVKYSAEFYDSVVKNETLDGRPLYSCVAVTCTRDKESCYRICYGNGHLVEVDRYPLKRLGQHVGIKSGIATLIDQGSSQSVSDVPFYCQEVYNDSHEENRTGISTSFHDTEVSLLEDGLNNAINPVVGVIVGAFTSINDTNIPILKKLVRNPKTHGRLFYIMTLGSSPTMRRKGLSTKLVLDCIRLVQQVKDCGAIYLHVITYNDAAIQFYEKLGFYRIEEIQGEFSLQIDLLCWIVDI
jgi:ribosomal protein S18 acetylase RimI-like enzyme